MTRARFKAGVAAQLGKAAAAADIAPRTSSTAANPTLAACSPVAGLKILAVRVPAVIVLPLMKWGIVFMVSPV